ncbi:hypothetical protein D3C71_1977420 [compost metagenome]
MHDPAGQACRFRNHQPAAARVVTHIRQGRLFAGQAAQPVLVQIDAEHLVDQVWDFAATDAGADFQEDQGAIVFDENLQMERGAAQRQRAQALSAERFDPAA